MRSVIVVGDGAVGTAVAVALSSDSEVILAGPPETVPCRREFTTKGSFCRSAEIFHTAIDRVQTSGLVIVALKARDIKGAVHHIRAFSSGEMICLSNGMGLSEEWGELENKVEYAVLSLGFRKTGQSTVLTADGSIFCRSSGLVSQVFRNSGFPLRKVVNIQKFRWAKWYANSVINPIAALAGLKNNELIPAGLQSLINALSLEISECMPSSGSIVEGQRILDWLLEYSSNRCSMLQDMERGRPTEIDFLTGLCIKRLQDKCPTATILVSLVKARTLQSDQLT
ncbi:MAG: ketopantoate reductase family protein [Candidatus Sabulitectum sp.]|nr:ketopantoate reductase family protein [Candidatus Sabulitectum sp.]